MEAIVYYERSSKSWYGFWRTVNNVQMHKAVFAHDRDSVLIELGVVKEIIREAYSL